MDVKKVLEDKFNILVNSAIPIGEGHDSKAHLINNEYVFKFGTDKEGYKKEKAICNFLNSKLKTNIKIPDIEYSFIGDEVSILGYKEIKGKFLNPKLYSTLTKEEKNQLKIDVVDFLKSMHDLATVEISSYIVDEITDKFGGKKCLCHNDFSCNHLLLDDNNRLCGVIDFGDAGITDEYCDFIYLLEDSEEEIGQEFGEDILRLYGNIDIEKAKEYRDAIEHYYAGIATRR